LHNITKQLIHLTSKVGITEASSNTLVALLCKVSACFYSGYGNLSFKNTQTKCFLKVVPPYSSKAAMSVHAVAKIILPLLHVICSSMHNNLQFYNTNRKTDTPASIILSTCLLITIYLN